MFGEPLEGHFGFLDHDACWIVISFFTHMSEQLCWKQQFCLLLPTGQGEGGLYPQQAAPGRGAGIDITGSGRELSKLDISLHSYLFQQAEIHCISAC